MADQQNDRDGGTELPPEETEDMSQSIFKPELGDDDRGPIDELEMSDGGEEHDPDSGRLGDVEPADERDGTES